MVIRENAALQLRHEFLVFFLADFDLPGGGDAVEPFATAHLPFVSTDISHNARSTRIKGQTHLHRLDIVEIEHSSRKRDDYVVMRLSATQQLDKQRRIVEPLVVLTSITKGLATGRREGPRAKGTKGRWGLRRP